MKLIINSSDYFELAKALDKIRYAPKAFYEQLAKAVYPVGTIRTWKGKKYIKVTKGPRQWVRYYEKGSRLVELAKNRIISKVRAGLISEQEIDRLMLKFEKKYGKHNMGGLKDLLNKILSDFRKQQQEKAPKAEKKEIIHGKEKVAERIGGAGRELVVGGRSTGGKNQPYRKDGIIVGRAEATKKTDKKYLSKEFDRQLKAHQRDAVNLIMENYEKGNKGFLLADGTGAGKTVQELALAQTKADRGEAVVIVTANKRIIEDAFKKDAAMLGVEYQYVTKMPEGNYKKGKIYITTYDKLENVAQRSGESAKVDQIIFDEAHNLKNVLATKSKYGKKLIKETKNVLDATATPIDKATHIDYLCATFGFDTGAVRKELGYTYTGKFQKGVTAEEAAKRVGAFFTELTNMGLMVKREVSMDNVDYDVENVAMPSSYMKKYRKARKNMIDEIEKAEAEGKNTGLIKARNLMSIRRLLEEAKSEYAYDMVVEELQKNKQAVVYATRMSDTWLGEDIGISEASLGKLRDKLNLAGIATAEVTGKTKKPQEEMNAFQNGDKKVILVSEQAGSTGLNLDDRTGTAPRTMIVLSAPYSANQVVQIFGRINRLTTKSRAKIRMLATNTEVDRWNIDLVANKMKLLGASVNGDYEKIRIRGYEGEPRHVTIGAGKLAEAADDYSGKYDFKSLRPAKEAGGFAPTSVKGQIILALKEGKKVDRAWAKKQGISQPRYYQVKQQVDKLIKEGKLDLTKSKNKLIMFVDELSKGNKRDVGHQSKRGYIKTAKGWRKLSGKIERTLTMGGLYE